MLYIKTLLSRYLTISSDPHDYAQLLTDRACEVEEIHIRTLPDDVVIGYVTEVKKHPDADKLVVCKLDCGSKGQFQICTGAVNIAAGQYVPVAIPGCFLPAINLKIDPRQMRGVDSNGMICSKNELGIGLDAGQHRIWVIQGQGLRTDPGNAESGTAGDVDTLTEKDTGTPLREVFPWLEGWIIDVENKTITHRPDLFGHFGLAVETRTMFPDDVTFSRLPEVLDQMNEGSLMQVMTHSTESQEQVYIQSPACRCYSLISYDDVKVGATDLFMKLALLDIGIQSTNNWVDFSNIFMQTTGQPVHFFDADKLSGSIVIRQAHDGEVFVDLFDTEHKLTVDDLVICDDNGVIALAGVVGGKTTGITEQTTRVAVEIANFDPVMIRKTALRVGLRTEAQIRYEKDINPLFTLACVQLFQDELAYHTPSLGSPTFTGIQWELSNGDTPLHHRISYDAQRIWSQVIGGDLNDEGKTQIEQIFTGLGFTLGESSIVTPAWRGPDDLTGQHDLVEEVARMIGYNTIPERELAFPLQFAPLTPRKKLIKDIESLLADQYRMDHIQTYSWMHDKWLAYDEAPPAYTIANAIDSDRNSMRPTMLRGLVEAVQKNQGTFDTQRIFDIGRCRDSEGNEHLMLGVMIVAPTSTDWNDHPQHTMKTLYEDIVDLSGARGKLESSKTELSYAHPLQQASLSLNRTLHGRILTLHPGFIEAHGLLEDTTFVFAEISLTQLLEARVAKRKKKQFASLKDHIIRRDVAFVIDSDVDYGTITQGISKVREVKDCEVFDLYAGKGMPEGKKSIGIRYKTIFEETPTTEQINEILEKVIKAGEKSGGELRGK